MKLIVTVCLDPSCIWISIPWPARLWWRTESGDRCPRCGGRVIVTMDTVLMDLEHIWWTRAIRKGNENIS